MTTKVQAEFLAAGIISDQTQVSAADADHVLIFDASDNSLKKALVSTVGGGGSSAADDITAGDAAVTISTSSGNITIDNGSSDDDIIFKGTDGGSDITALTLDMSEAGKATFNSDVALGDSKKLLLGASDDLQIYHDGSNSYVVDAGTGGLVLRGTNTVDIQSALGHNYLKSTISAGTQIYYDNAEKFATVSGGVKVTGDIENASGNMRIDVAGKLFLESDDGRVDFEDGGTTYFRIENSSTDAVLQSTVQDKDLIFKGNDGGSVITALTLDMSAEGGATFNSNITLHDNKGVYFGAGSDLIIYSDGTDAILDASGDIILDADSSSIRFKDGGTLNSRLGLDSAGLIITVEGSDKDFFINGNDGGSGITAVRVDMSDAGALICNGNITAFGSPSDIRLKENIEVIPGALDKVKQLKGVTFNYKKDGKKSTGLIAQDLEKVLPEVVYETSTTDKGDEEKHLAVRYGNTVGLLVEAIKELSAKIEKLEGK